MSDTAVDIGDFARTRDGREGVVTYFDGERWLVGGVYWRAIDLTVIGGYE